MPPERASAKCITCRWHVVPSWVDTIPDRSGQFHVACPNCGELNSISWIRSSLMIVGCIAAVTLISIPIQVLFDIPSIGSSLAAIALFVGFLRLSMLAYLRRAKRPFLV
jgi:hypothetical protein